MYDKFTKIWKELDLKFIIESPRIRLGIVLALTILIGVFSSSYVTEITENGNLQWDLSIYSRAFWLLALVSILWIILQVAQLKSEEDVLQYIDNNYCMGFLRRIKLDALARLAKTDPERASLIDIKQIMESIEAQHK